MTSVNAQSRAMGTMGTKRGPRLHPFRETSVIASSARWRLAASAVPLLTLGLLAGCASAPPRAERYIPPPMGSTWEYARTGTGSFGQSPSVLVLSIERTTWDGRPAYAFKNPAQTTIQGEWAELFAQLSPSGEIMVRYDPPIGWQWPLEVGKTWTVEHVATVPSRNLKVPFKGTWKVAAREEVTVPAGTFMAWRLEYSDTLGEMQTIWSVPEDMGAFAKRSYTRSATHAQGAGTLLLEMTRRPSRP
jgi:hypothetical protein